MQIALFILRLSGLLLFILVCFFLVIIFYPVLPKRYWIYFVRMWANGVLLFMGVKVQIDGDVTPYVEKNALVVANHISWLDIPILYTQHSVGFIGRNEMKKWPVLSLLIKSGSTIFIDRTRKRDLIHINNVVSQKLREGATVGLFPEGKTSDGKGILPFKPSLFEATIMAKSTIIPLVIQYYTKDGKPTNAVTYADEITLWESVKNSLGLNGIIAKVIPLPRIYAANFKNRDEISDYLYKEISDRYNLYLAEAK